MIKQELARQRNWQLARLLGITFNKEVLSEEEKLHVEEIKRIVRILLDNWDTGTRQVGLTPSRTRRCKICFKKRILRDNLACNQCHKTFQDSNNVVTDETRFFLI